MISASVIPSQCAGNILEMYEWYFPWYVGQITVGILGWFASI